MDDQLQFCSVEEAVEEIRQGRMIIVTDDPGRENEADLIIAAEFATPEAINFMATHARGLICAPLSPERADTLQLPLMTSVNRENMSTAFTVSVDAAHDITTGISAGERSLTIRTLADPKARQRLRAARPRLPAPRRSRRGAPPRRPYGSHHRPRAHGGTPARRSLL